MSGQFQDFNALDDGEARRLLASCLDVPRWVEEVNAGRPYADRASLLAAADASARTLSPEELDAALAGHPRIGERAGAGHNATASSREQAGVDARDDAVTARLADGNAAYEQRFDRVFLIRAAGRSGEDILAELERRLCHDDDTERAEVVDNLREITLLRLEQAV